MTKISGHFPVLWLLFASLHLVRGIDLKAKLYPKRLTDSQDCETFSRQSKYMVAKCDAYYDATSQSFFLDDAFKHNLLKCAKYHSKNNHNQQLPAIIYRVRNVTDYGKGTILKDMVKLEGAVDYFLEIVPQITFMVGPGGKSEDQAKNINSISTSWVAIIPAERENRMTFYPQAFFNQLNQVEGYCSSVANKYLVLNGWHLRNIPTIPQIDRNLLNIFAGLIVYVERAHAHHIGKNEVVKFLNGTTTMPVWYDMPGSPEFGAAAQLPRPVAVVAAAVLLSWLCRRV